MANIKKGAKGASVKKLQTALNTHGAKPKLVIDGDFGPKTDEAVRNFQKDSKLKVDGIVGKNTSAALGYKATSKGGRGIVIPVWDLGNYVGEGAKVLDTMLGYLERHEKLSAYIEKVIISRIKKFHEAEKELPEAKGLADIFAKRYFELKGVFQNIVAHYRVLDTSLNKMEALQNAHQKALKNGKILDAERALKEAEAESAKMSKMYANVQKAIAVYDKHHKRMDDVRKQMLTVFGSKFMK